MKKKVAIIDYQMSNLYSVKHACDFIGLDAVITADTSTIAASDGAILPGVGSFGDAMKNLQKLGLDQAIRKFIADGKPFMGVCLGMQLLFSESEEFGKHEGLGILHGRVVKFASKKMKIRIPQIGWNKIVHNDAKKSGWKHTPFASFTSGEFMYFVHSYYVVPKDSNAVLSHTNYGDVIYCSAVYTNNIFATQFHPEKSGEKGIAIYRNWAALLS